MKRGLSLAIRIIGISVLLVTIVLLVMNYLVTDQVRKGIQESQIHNLQQSVDLAGRYLDDSIQVVRNGINERASRIDEARTAGQDTAFLNDLLYQGSQKEALLIQLMIVDRSAMPIARSHENSSALALEDMDIGKLIQSAERSSNREVLMGKAVKPSKDGPILVPLIQRLGESSRDQAYLLALMDLDALFTKTARQQVYGKEGYPFIGDSYYRILSHPSVPFSDQRGQVFMDEANAAIAAGNSSGVIAYPWQGRFKQLSFKVLENSNLYIAATVWDDDLFSLANQITETQIFIGLGALGLIIVSLSFAIVFFVTKPLNTLTNTLARNADSLESASQQISASSEQLSAGSSELAASVEEISASLEELESVVELNTKNINQSELLMRDTNEGAQKVSSRMIVLGDALKEIGNSSSEIVQIITVIEDIAFQTNILALNAAVEAGRAGDAGRGFSVVADQVKDLAQKSSTAVKETSVLIQKAIKNIEKGETLGGEVMEIQSKAAHMAGQVSVLLDEVNRASQEQMKGIKQINIAVGQTNSVVQQAASSAEETAAASEELFGQAEELNSAVGMLSRLVRGRTDAKNKENSSDQKLRKSKVMTERSEIRQLADSPSTKPKRAPTMTQFDPDSIMPMNDDFEKM